MKKVLIATGIAALAFASVAAAAFNVNLTVGSRGADVAALQTWLNSNGYPIAAIQSGAATPGYFGTQTKAAVKLYQAAHGIPNTGFVGPLTRAALNSGGVAMSPASCPLGYTCTANAAAPVPVCPLGYTCTANPGTPPLLPGNPTLSGITTPGIPGSLDVSLQSGPSGATLDKGQTADVASFKLKAGDSDMAVSSIAVDFNNRMWLYASSITLLDGTTVVAQKSGLSDLDFTELTVGTSYRLRFNGLNYIPAKSSTHYLTVRITMLPSSDRAAATSNTAGANAKLAIIGFEVRAIDGTGVTLTSNASGATSDLTGIPNNACGGSIVCRTFSYTGSNNGQVIPALSPSQPKTGLVQISTSATTDGVILGEYQLKSESRTGTLRSLSVNLGISGNGNAVSTIANIFNTIQLVVGSQVVATGNVATPTGPGLGGAQQSTVSFTDFNVSLPADVYTDIKIIGKVAQNTNSQFDGTNATTTLVASTATVNVEDSAFNSVAVNNVTLSSNTYTLTSSPLVASNMSTTYGTFSNQATPQSQQFTYNFSLTAGNNPIFVSKSATTTLNPTVVNTSGALTVSPLNFSADDTNGDDPASPSLYFYVGPNQTKVFHAVYTATGLSGSAGSAIVNSIKYGTTTAALAGGSLNQTDISNNLKALLFH